ncbi:hypothetical protein ACUNGZ_18140 [Serratia sp. IR-2025]
MFAGKKSAQIREILISESAWEEMTCLFAPSLTPGRYVGSAEQEEDNEPFAEKMARLAAQLKTQLEESAKLEAQIKANLGGLGYEF